MIEMNYIFSDENNKFQFNFSQAIWAINDLKGIYNKKIQSVLSDVDFIAETDNEIIFMEYKNSLIKNANNPKAFDEKLTSDDHYIKIAKKYYGSILYTMACKKEKEYKYVYVLESAFAGSTDRKRLRNKIINKLPFELQKDSKVKHKLINDFEVLSIDEWNKDPLYSRFPISLIGPST